MKGSTKARHPLNITLSPSTLRGFLFIQQYRFLTIPQFAKCANISVYHTGEVLRNLERWGALGYFGFVPIPGAGKTPKVYYLKRRGWEILQSECTDIEPFSELQMDFAWTPAMYHRLRTIDLFLSLEMTLADYPHLSLVRTFLEHRRRETVDYVAEGAVSENRIVPDGAFVLENTETGTKALFFVETDMGTERIVGKAGKDVRGTVFAKLGQYDRYLAGGRFAKTYAPYGEFRSFLLLFVTTSEERIDNIRQAAARLNSRLHGYYRLGTFQETSRNFLGPVWKSRDVADASVYALVRRE